MLDKKSSSLLAAIGNSTGRVAIVGSLNADYTIVVDQLPRPGETVMGSDLSLLPGGKSSNQAAQAALLGAQVSMYGLVGTDTNGDFLIDQLARTGADTSCVGRTEGSSGTAFINVDADAENTIVVVLGANALLSPEYIRSCADELACAHVLGLCLESPMETVREAARIGHEAGTTVLLNCSPLPTELPRDLMDNVDVLLVNKTEAAQLTGLLTEDLLGRGIELRTRMAALGFERVVVTLGSAGSLVLEPGGIAHIDGIAVAATDTTGCGDSFMGAILAGLAANASLADAARLASYVAAYAARSRGAQASYGTADQIACAF